MLGPAQLRRKLFRLLPRRRQLRGGCLHRLLGERLFRPELWKPSQRGLAGGLALGLFLGFTPTMGAQFLLAGLAAYFLRVNIPIAMAGTLVTNPFTAAIVYPLLYRLGVWLIGTPDAAALERLPLAMRAFVRYGEPLWAGSLVAGAVAAVMGYLAGSVCWALVQRARAERNAHRDLMPQHPRSALTAKGIR